MGKLSLRGKNLAQEQIIVSAPSFNSWPAWYKTSQSCSFNHCVTPTASYLWTWTYYSVCGPAAPALTWELVKNADSSQPQPQWTEICIWQEPQVIHMHLKVWEALATGDGRKGKERTGKKNLSMLLLHKAQGIFQKLAEMPKQSEEQDIKTTNGKE